MISLGLESFLADESTGADRLVTDHKTTDRSDTHDIDWYCHCSKVYGKIPLKFCRKFIVHCWLFHQVYITKSWHFTFLQIQWSYSDFCFISQVSSDEYAYTSTGHCSDWLTWLLGPASVCPSPLKAWTFGCLGGWYSSSLWSSMSIETSLPLAIETSSSGIWL